MLFAIGVNFGPKIARIGEKTTPKKHWKIGSSKKCLLWALLTIFVPNSTNFRRFWVDFGVQPKAFVDVFRGLCFSSIFETVSPKKAKIYKLEKCWKHCPCWWIWGSGGLQETQRDVEKHIETYIKKSSKTNAKTVQKPSQNKNNQNIDKKTVLGTILSARPWFLADFGVPWGGPWGGLGEDFWEKIFGWKKSRKKGCEADSLGGIRGPQERKVWMEKPGQEKILHAPGPPRGWAGGLFTLRASRRGHLEAWWLDDLVAWWHKLQRNGNDKNMLPSPLGCLVDCRVSKIWWNITSFEGAREFKFHEKCFLKGVSVKFWEATQILKLLQNGARGAPKWRQNSSKIVSKSRKMRWTTQSGYQMAPKTPLPRIPRRFLAMFGSKRIPQRGPSNFGRPFWSQICQKA